MLRIVGITISGANGWQLLSLSPSSQNPPVRQLVIGRIVVIEFVELESKATTVSF